MILVIFTNVICGGQIMSDLKFNDLPKILKWIKKNLVILKHLFIIEQTLKSVKGSDQFKVGTKVKFGRANGVQRMGVVVKLEPKKDSRRYLRSSRIIRCSRKWRVYLYDLMTVVTE